MSKPTPREGIVRLSPEQQLESFADFYRPQINSAQFAQFKAHCAELGLHFPDDELAILAALDQPDQVQEFLNTQIYYNDDHTVPNVEETAMPPRQILQTGLAHCFEGALFAYAVNYLHGHVPRLVLLESSQDADHNLILVQDPSTGFYGCNAHSAYPTLDGRAAHYSTIRGLAESYHPHYYSDWTRDPRDLTLVGFSEPIDLTAKFGVAWIGSMQPLWDIYYTYIDDTARFHYLFDDASPAHDYPLIRGLKEHWIRIDSAGKCFVSVDDLSPDAQKLWRDFWRTFDAQVYPHPRGEALQIEKEFFRLTGTTPIDLTNNAFDFQFYLDTGYRTSQLVTSHSRL